MTQAIKETSKESVLSYFIKYIYDKDSRRKISSQVFGKNHPMKIIESDSAHYINWETFASFKLQMPLYPTTYV